MSYKRQDEKENEATAMYVVGGFHTFLWALAFTA